MDTNIKNTIPFTIAQKKKKKTQKYLGVNLTIYKRGLCTESYTVVVEKNWKRAKINEEIHYIHRLNDSTW